MCLVWASSHHCTSSWHCVRGQKKCYWLGMRSYRRLGGILIEMGGLQARIKVTYSTINNGWRQRWKAVGGWHGWGGMTTVCIDDGNRADDDASASSPVPCSPTRWWWQRWCGPSCTSRTETERAMMPRHHYLSLAHLRDGNGSGSGGRSCASTAATGQTMMPRIITCPSLALAMAMAMAVAEVAHADN